MTLADEQIAERIARDARFDAVQLGVDIEADLRDSRPLKAIYDGFKRDAEVALLEFAEANLADRRAVMDLQARVYRSVKSMRTIEAIRQSASIAMADLLNEQRAEGQDERND